MTAADGAFDEPLEEVRAILPAPAEIGIYPICIVLHAGGSGRR